MFSMFFPDEDCESAYTVDYERLYQAGFRGIIFDIDNTLVEHGAKADKRSAALIARLREMGYAVCFLSNNKEPRVKSFAGELGAAYIFKAGKPKKEGYEAAIKLLGVTKKQAVSVGDQIFTDIWGANRAGIYTVLVKQIGKKEEIQIVLKRYLERVVLYFYRKNRKKKKGNA
ncbi:MAG: YqeG family HAD IIIA-type phosphatase [Lachnospiraceae bacterium]|nr:YqeG family HAD IIIA-type phosphatase [Lachnospiraceae bacterium]